MIQVKNLKKEYEKVEVLKDVNLNVYDGEVYGIVGGNGAGKSTLLNLISGFERPDNGDIKITGKDIRIMKSIPHLIGYVLDTPNCYSYMTAKEYLNYLSSCTRLTKKDAESHIDQLIEMFDLTNFMNKRVNTYSKGMKQKLSIAGVLLGDPKVLLMDEPTNSLDEKAKDNFKKIILKLKNAGKNIIITTNSLWDIEQYCDRVGFLVDGIITSEKTVSSIKKEIVLRYRITAEAKTLSKLYNHFSSIGYRVEKNLFDIQVISSNFLTKKDVENEIDLLQLQIYTIDEYVPTFKDILLKEVSL